MKKTLLQIVQDILTAMDSEEVNSISETIEADQIAGICELVYFELVNSRDIPEHGELIKLTAASDSAYPTHFHFPANVDKLKCIWYTNNDGKYYEVDWMEPLDFLNRIDGIESDYDTVADKNGGTSLRIKNNSIPKFYTSFDDNWLVFDSYDSTKDTTLQESKVRTWGNKLPSFSKSNSFIPDLDANMFPYYIAECTSRSMSLLKGAPDPKVEQAARRQNNYLNSRKYRNERPNNWSNYGR
jgi:hypothetical protein